MKIKKIGWTTFSITTNNLSVLTDPLVLKELKQSFPKTQSDVIIITKYKNTPNENILTKEKLDTKIIPDKRNKIMEIYTPGEYEVGGIMIRRGLNEDFYVIDEKEHKSSIYGSSR